MGKIIDASNSFLHWARALSLWEMNIMRCEEMRDLLDLHLDGELPTDTARKIERHLLRCPPCAHELHTLRQTRNMLREAVAPSETTPGFRERTLARLHNEFAPHARPAAINARQWTLPFREEAS